MVEAEVGMGHEVQCDGHLRYSEKYEARTSRWGVRITSDATQINRLRIGQATRQAVTQHEGTPSAPKPSVRPSPALLAWLSLCAGKVYEAPSTL